MRVAFLSSYTIEPLAKHIVLRAVAHGLTISPWVAPFDTWAQQLIDPASALATFKPDVTVIAVEEDRLVERGTEDGGLSLKDISQDFFDRVENLARQGGKVLIHSFRHKQSFSGVLDGKERKAALDENSDQILVPGGENGQTYKLNDDLRRKYAKNGNVFILDLNSVVWRAGVPVIDPKFDLLAAMKWTEQFLPALADAHLSYLLPLAGKSRKVLALDLDGTLWGGVVGEDGPAGIALGPQAPGNAYVAFQRAVAAIARRGIVLVINSKNNEVEALEVIRNHPSMVLREKDFAAARINWNDKVRNLRELAAELNLGLDSFVFADDDPANRALVRQELPEVLTLEMPEDPARYAEFLLSVPELEALSVTDEDRGRAAMYAADRERRASASSASSLDSYLRSLDMRAEIREDAADQIPRLAQLTMKTNQFNCTTRRYTEAEMRHFVEEPNTGVWSIRVADRFGDNGIVGLAVVKKESSRWLLDSFLLSCRVIGRGIEQALLSRVVGAARSAGAAEIIGEFIPTAKNAPAKDFFSASGFEPIGGSLWRFPLNKDIPAPNWITYG